MVLDSLRDVMVEMDRLPQAIRYANQLIALLDEDKDVPDIIDHLYIKGDLEAYAEKYRAAMHSYHRGADIAHKLSDRNREYEGVHRLGLLYSLWRKPHLATTYYQSAVMIADGLKNNENKTQGLLSLAINYAQRGNYSAASDIYDKALAFSQKYKIVDLEALIFYNYGMACFEQQLFGRAKTHWQTALKLFELHGIDEMIPTVKEILERIPASL
jgi:tetratricopeptide (TPR) repeat protein